VSIKSTARDAPSGAWSHRPAFSTWDPGSGRTATLRASCWERPACGACVGAMMRYLDDNFALRVQRTPVYGEAGVGGAAYLGAWYGRILRMAQKPSQT
jgi:hypothetical protein